MTQAGFNLGPRHARVLGYAKSFTKSLSEEEKEIQDQDVIGAGSLMWSLIQSHMPKEVVDEVKSSLAQKGMPSIATAHVSPGASCNFAMQTEIAC